MKIKRGDTLSFIVVKKDSKGVPVTGQDIKSHVRDINKKVAEFIVKETDVPGSYEFTIPASITKTLPIKKLYFDIRFEKDGVVETSPTVELEVEANKTYDDSRNN